MASESKLENVMLTGQNAYFKKNGSMKNHGTIELENALSAHNYDEGYIGPNSILHGTDLAETNEYAQCEFMMKTFLEDAWEEKEGERTVITNGNNMKTALLPGETYMRQLYNDITFDGTELEYIQCTGTQYIRTNIPLMNYDNWKIELDIKLSDIGYNYNGIWGLVSGTTLYECWVGSDGINYNRYNNTKSAGLTMTTTRMKYTDEFTGSIMKTYIDNVLKRSYNVSLAKNSSQLKLLQCSASSGKSYLYSAKIYGNQTLLAEFIPCKDPDGIACLYDKVSKQYFYNSGTGTDRKSVV